MHVKPGSHVVLLSFVIVSAALALANPRSAHAQVTDAATCPASPPACTPSTTGCCTRDFVGSSSQKAIVIPMDRCHQNPATGALSANTASPVWCSNPVANGEGMNRAYGLVYRLMQYGIPVYWVVNPTKAPSKNTSVSDTWTEKDVDFWVLSNTANPPASGSGLPAIPALQNAPVRKMTSATSSPYTLSSTASTYSRGAFPVRGGAFVIAAADRPAFEAFWARRIGSSRSCGTSGLDCLDFRDVTMWEVHETARFAWQDFTKAPVSGSYVKYDNQLPVAMKVDYAPPRIALVDGNLLKNWLAKANLDDTESGACVNGSFTNRNAVACVMSEANVQAGLLKAAHTDGGTFTWAWFDIGTSSTCGTTLGRIKEFITAVPGFYSAGNVMFASTGIKLAEECAANKGTLGKAGTGLSLNTSGINETATKTLIFRYPTNLFSQYGDLIPDFAAGSPASYDRVAGGTDLYSSTYLTAPSTLRRLLTAERAAGTNCANHKDTGTTGATSPASCDDTGTSSTADITDLYVYGRYLNDVDNGIVFYSPGNNITPNNQQAQLRLVLSAILATPPLRKEQTPTTKEISRSNPITAVIEDDEAIVQGSFEYTYVTYPDPISTLAFPANLKQYPVPRTVSGVYNTADVDAFTFPAQRGHMRARKASTITTTGNTFDASPTNVLFDAATAIPPATLTGCTADFQGTCRSVWTTTTAPTAGRTSKPARVMLKTNDTTNRATLKALVLPNDASFTFTDTHYDTVVGRVLAGIDNGSGTFSPGLGGVDRSTVAVIPASTVAKPAAPFTGQRPTVAYFGATDGMLHAVCASVDASKGCDVLGRELWAYVPRTNLKNLRYNTARVDGSPRVLDVRGNWNNDGNYSWKTVLIFQTGTGSSSTANGGPSVIALDVTNPQDPNVIWERTTSSTPGTYDLGVGLTIASGAATIGTGTKNVTILVTNNGGTAGSALVVTAVNTDDGTDLWGAANNPDGIPANQGTRFAYKYITETGHTASNGLPPTSGVPGGATSVDKTLVGLNGFMTDIVVTDLYGSVWVLDPATGRSRYTTNNLILLDGTDIPMFQFSTDFHPIGAKAALYGFGSTQYVVFTDGGYVDTTGTVTWGCVMVNLVCTYPTPHYLMAVSLAYPVSSTISLNENSGATYIPIKVALGSGERGWSQAYVVNDQIFVTTETADVNLGTYGTSATSTGKMYNVAASGGGSQVTTATTAVIFGGGSSVIGAGGTLYASSSSKQQQLGVGAGTGIGVALNKADTDNLKRRLWLRAE